MCKWRYNPTLTRRDQKDLKESFIIAKLTKSSHLTPAQPEVETRLDKTTRIVKEITEKEAEIRQEKTAHLRKARHESKAESTIKTNDVKPLKAKKKT